MAETIDTSRKYEPSAGPCDKCGFFKTWQFKVVNPKTGKQVPGHINSDGFKIGDGDCPYYAQREKMTGFHKATEPPAKPAAAAPPSTGTVPTDEAFMEGIAIKLEDIVLTIRRHYKP